jgi:hypothetical protein
MQRRLKWIRWVSLVDALLLAALVGGAVTGRREAVHVLGPLHGLNFLMLVALAADGALKRWWGWWFPAAIVVLLGPLGSLAGERYLKRG